MTSVGYLLDTDYVVDFLKGREYTRTLLQTGLDPISWRVSNELLCHLAGQKLNLASSLCTHGEEGREQRINLRHQAPFLPFPVSTKMGQDQTILMPPEKVKPVSVDISIITYAEVYAGILNAYQPKQ